MYGIVNKAITDLVVAKFGIDTWNKVAQDINLDIDYFVSNEPYHDDITYKLVAAIANEKQIAASDFLFELGEYWVLHTGIEKYGGLMEAGGVNLKEFLVNLPDFHNRIMLMYPKLTPPEFRISDETDNSIQVHYYSQRPGLKDFVLGLLQGLSKMYHTEADIELLASRDEGADHEIFKVSW